MLWRPLSVLMLCLAALCARPAPALADAAAAEELYGQAYDVERASGDLAAALALYQQIVVQGSASTRPVAARAWFRIGVCSDRLGDPDGAREAWGRLLREYPEETDLCDRAEAELRQLTSRVHRVRVHGRVVDAAGHGAAGVYVQIGNGMFEPPAVTDALGRFSVERRVARARRGEVASTVVYAEHPRLPLGAAIAVDLPVEKRGLRLSLRPTGLLRGLVRRAVDDRAGDAALVRARTFVPGARVTVSAEFDSGAQLVVAELVADDDGEYQVSNLVSGVSYRIEAQARGFVLATAAECKLHAGTAWAPEVLLRKSGRHALRGVVTDGDGQPLEADVSVFSTGVRERWLASARTTADGAYALSGLPEEPLTISVNAPAFPERSVSWIAPSTEEIHVVLRADAPVPVAAAIGLASPELDVQGLNTSKSRLAHFTEPLVLVCFWSARRALLPPDELGRLHERLGRSGLALACILDHSVPVWEERGRVSTAGIQYPVLVDTYGASAFKGAQNNVTFARYGARHGDAFLIGTNRVLLAKGAPQELGAMAESMLRTQAAEARASADTPRVVAEWVSSVDASVSPPESATVMIGRAPPPFTITRWFRRDAEASAVTGRVSVLRFASVYTAAARAEDYPQEPTLCEQLQRVYPGQVKCTWILPSSDREMDAQQYLARHPVSGDVGIDADRSTYTAYGVDAAPESAVIGADGKVIATGVPDAQLFRVVRAAVIRDLR